MSNEIAMHIIKLTDAESKVLAYKKRFEKISIPYVLPNIRYEWSFSPQQFESSRSLTYVAMPIKNQETDIFSILWSLCDSMNSNFCIGVVLDNCTDKSFQEVRRFVDSVGNKVPNLIRIDVLTSDGDLFESTCENVLFEFCNEPYFMSLQADIFLADKSFVSRSIRAFEQNQKLAGISGRARVSFYIKPAMAQYRFIRFVINAPNYFAPKIVKRRKLGWNPPRTGYFGDISEYPKSRMKFSKRELLTIYTGEAIIRGPLIWRSEIFRKLGGYNDISYFLGRDDCDLSLRARLILGMFVAYLPSRSYSFSQAGTTRKKRDSRAIAELKAREELSSCNPGALDNFWAGKLQCPPIKFQTVRIKKQT